MSAVGLIILFNFVCNSHFQIGQSAGFTYYGNCNMIHVDLHALSYFLELGELTSCKKTAIATRMGALGAQSSLSDVELKELKKAATERRKNFDKWKPQQFQRLMNVFQPSYA
jgi:hypothetical protein